MICCIVAWGGRGVRRAALRPRFGGVARGDDRGDDSGIDRSSDDSGADDSGAHCSGADRSGDDRSGDDSGAARSIARGAARKPSLALLLVHHEDPAREINVTLFLTAAATTTTTITIDSRDWCDWYQESGADVIRGGASSICKVRVWMLLALTGADSYF